MKTAAILQLLLGHFMQTLNLVQPDKPASPKFMVTLDGVPIPQRYMQDQEEDMCCEGMKPINKTAASNRGLRDLLHPQQLQLMNRQLEGPDGSFTKAEMSELSLAQKPEKLLKHCKYWSAYKNWDEYVYHHSIVSCKAFLNCKFAEKCLLAHLNCKYDAKCTKPDCPFSHMRVEEFQYCLQNQQLKHQSHPLVVSSAATSVCKKTECPFYYPKHYRFNTVYQT
jgi:hypothetical protein